MSQDQHYKAVLPRELEVKDVSNDSSGSLTLNEQEHVIYGGIVEEWKALEFSERKKARPYLVSIVVVVWAISVIASAFRLVVAGNVLLAIPPALVSVPLNTVLKFYFKGG